jgi:hypothetical protein
VVRAETDLSPPPDKELRGLAAQVKLPGGSIRNIVVDAAFRALGGSGGECRIDLRHLVLATAREYQKLGKPITMGDFGAKFYSWLEQELCDRFVPVFGRAPMNQSKALLTERLVHSQVPVPTPAVARTGGREMPQRAAGTSLARHMDMARRIGGLAPSSPGDEAHGGGSVQRAVLSKTLQRTLGNARLGRMAEPPPTASGVAATNGKKRPIQTQLTVGPANDPFEREADVAASRIAAGQQVQRISRLSGSGMASAHRKCAACGKEMEQEPAAGGSAQRKCTACEEEKKAQRQPKRQPRDWTPESEKKRTAPVQTKAAGTTSREPGLDTERAERAMVRSGPGSPLAPAMRTKMEEGFDADFSGVRVHTGAAADEASRAVNASAFTRGSDIYLARGESAADHGLMAHELTHTVQQEGKQLRRARTQAQEGAAKGGAPEWEKGPLNFLSTAQQSRVERKPTGQSEEPRVAPPETSLTDQRPQLQSSAPADVQTKRRSGGQGNSTDRQAPGTQNVVDEKEGGAEKSGSKLISRRITPADSPSIQRQLEPLVPLVGYGTAVMIGKNSVYELKGSEKFEPDIFLRAYLYHHGDALINVQFGEIAKGKMYVEDRGPDGYRAGPTGLLMTHPEISPPGRGQSLSLIVQIGPNNEITGSLGVTKPLPPNSIGSAPGSPEDQERFLTLLIGQSGSKGKLENIEVRNELKDGHLGFAYTFKNTFHKGTYLIGSVAIIDEAFAFAGTLHTSGKGLVPADTEIRRDKAGDLIGRLGVSTDWEAKGFKGKLALTYEDGVLEIRGSLKYDSPRVKGEVNVLATEESRAWQAIQSQLAAVQEGPKSLGGAKPASSGQTAAPVAGTGAALGAAGAPGNVEDGLAITGWGVLKLTVTDKIDADAAFVVDPDGYLTVRGTIRAPHKITLMDAKPTEEEVFFDKDYSDMEYVGPAVGIRAKVHIIFTGKAEYGPLTLHDITITGLYSTRPDVGKELQISAKLNLSGSATAGLTVSGELALRLGTKYKYLGANPVAWSLNTAAVGQVRGVVEAEPTIKVSKGGSKDDVPKYTIGGELFIGGEADITLTGNHVFTVAGKEFHKIELDKKVFPIAGFGLTTKLAYTIGSDEMPDVTIKQGNFEPSRFIRQAIRGERAKGTQVEGGFKEGGKEKGHVIPSDVIPEAPQQQPKTQVIQFTMDGSQHSLYLTLGGPGDPVLLEMASPRPRRPVKIKILKAKNDLRDARSGPDTDDLAKKKIDRRVADLEQAEGDASRVEQAAAKLGAEPAATQLDVPGLKELGGELQDYGERYHVTDLEEPAPLVVPPGGPIPVVPPGPTPAQGQEKVADSNIFMDRIEGGPTQRQRIDTNFLANPNLTLHAPAAAIAEATAVDPHGTQARRLTGEPGGARIAPDVDGNVAPLRPKFDQILSAKFNENDLRITLRAAERNVPLLTAQNSLAAQVKDPTFPERVKVVGKISVEIA